MSIFCTTRELPLTSTKDGSSLGTLPAGYVVFKDEFGNFVAFKNDLMIYVTPECVAVEEKWKGKTI